MDLSIDTAGQQRVTGEMQALAASGGFASPRLWFAAGTKLYDVGRDRYREQRQKVDDMPTVDDACDTIIEEIQHEDRKDFLVPVRPGNLMYKDHHLWFKSKNYPDSYTFALPFEQNGFATFLARLYNTLELPSPTNYFLGLDPEDREARLNHDLARYLKRALDGREKRAEEQRKNRSRGRRANTEPTLKLRTRVNPETGKRAIFAAVTDSYASFDIDKVCYLVKDVFKQGWKSCIATDGFRSNIRMIMPNPIDADAAVVGEILRIAVELKTADDGTLALHFLSAAYRAICKNLTTVKLDGGLKLTRRHIGDADKLRHDVERSLSKVIDSFGKLPELWAKARMDKIIERVPGGAQEVFEQLVKCNLVKATHCRGDELVRLLLKSYYTDPQPTRIGVVNAITHMAHNQGWRSYQVQEELEQQAGQLLHVKLWHRTPFYSV